MQSLLTVQAYQSVLKFLTPDFNSLSQIFREHRLSENLTSEHACQDLIKQQLGRRIWTSANQLLAIQSPDHTEAQWTCISLLTCRLETDLELMSLECFYINYFWQQKISQYWLSKCVQQCLCVCWSWCYCRVYHCCKLLRESCWEIQSKSHCNDSVIQALYSSFLFSLIVEINFICHAIYARNANVICFVFCSI